MESIVLFRKCCNLAQPYLQLFDSNPDSTASEIWRSSASHRQSSEPQSAHVPESIFQNIQKQNFMDKRLKYPLQLSELNPKFRISFFQKLTSIRDM
jgi:hypothetical protein